MMSRYSYDPSAEYDTGDEPVPNLPALTGSTGRSLAVIDLNRVEFQAPDRSHAFLKRLTLLSGVVALVASGYLIRDTRLTEKLQFYADEIWSSSASTTSASRQAAELDTTDKVGVVPIQANSLFEAGGKGPRADHYLTATNSPQRPSVILASMSPVATDNAAPAPAAPYRDYVAVSRGKKSNLWRPGDPFDGEIQVAKATDESIPGPSRIVGNRATAGVFFASALGANSLENHKPQVQLASLAAPQQGGWEHLLQLARVTPQDATLLGGVSETEFRNRERQCMAIAIYFEARDEPLKGQIAVGQVIMNRVNSPYYPKTICSVVYEGSLRRTGCQFSFTCDGKTHRTTEKKEWETALEIAKQVIDGKARVKDVGNATHYHATYVHPAWRKMVTRVTQIGTHIFYTAPFADPSITYNHEEPDDADRAHIQKVQQQLAQEQQSQPAQPVTQTASTDTRASDGVENMPAQRPTSAFGFNGQ